MDVLDVGNHGKKTCRFSSFSASFSWFGKRKKHRNAPFLLGGRSSRFRPTKLKKGMQVRGRETGTHAKRTEITFFFNKLCLNLFRSGSRSVCCILDLLPRQSCPAAFKELACASRASQMPHRGSFTRIFIRMICAFCKVHAAS